MFSKFCKWWSKLLGSPSSFIIALLATFIWLITGPYFGYTTTWQLIINTTASVITLLMVFLIQNTQNRDTMALHLKLDEIIRSSETAHNELLKIEELDDDELENLHKRYEALAAKVKEKKKKGLPDIGKPRV